MGTDKLAPRKRHQWTSKKKADFIEALAAGVIVAAAAEGVGMSRSGAYKLREGDAAFDEAWTQAYEMSTELLEREAFERAVGREELAGFDKDGNPQYIKKYSDLLLIFLLKARKPKMYRERMDVNITEKRHIVLELIQLEKDEKTGRLMMVDDDVPLLSAGE